MRSVGPFKIYSIKGKPDIFFINDKDDTTIAEVYVSKEDACLFEASWELLAGLKQAVTQLKDTYTPTPLDGVSALIAKLEALIRKAEGKLK